MKKKTSAFILIMTVSLVFSFSAFQVYAKNTGIDFIALVTGKVSSIVNLNKANANKTIEKRRQQVERDVLAYIDSFIKGLGDEIDQYSENKKNEALTKLDSNLNDIKTELETIREGAVSDAKSEINQAIDRKYQEEQQKLDENLKKEIEKKFK